MASTELTSSSCAEIVVPLDLRRVSHGISVLPKVRQAACLVWWGKGDLSRSNRGESGIISIWFGIHWTISHSFGDISVIWDLWGCSWGLSGVPSSKSRPLTCLIGNVELLCMQCIGIRPRLSPTGKSHDFSRISVLTCGIFLSYGGDRHSKHVFVQRRQD